MNLEELRAYAEERFIPILRPPTEKVLISLLKSEEPKTVLEIGTAIGYSGSVILKNSNAHLTTIELNEERFTFAKNTFKNFNLTDRVTQILGDANIVIKTLDQEFDFIFLDGPKGQYLNELPDLYKLLSSTGTLFVDDIYYHGWVKGDAYPAHKHRTAILRLRKFIAECKELFPSLTLLDDGDGIMIAKKLNINKKTTEY